VPLYTPAIFQHISWSSSFETLARFTNGVANSAAVTLNASGLYLDKGTTAADGQSYAVFENSLPAYVWDQDPEFYINMLAAVKQTAGMSWDAYVNFGDTVGRNAAFTVGDHTFVGIHIKNNDGVQEVYAISNIAASTPTETLLDIGNNPLDAYGNLTSNALFYIKQTSGTQIDFYYNGVLKATHTTNVPSSASLNQPYPFAALFAGTVGVSGAGENEIQLKSVGMGFKSVI
jgi:hypothetical protein